MDKLQFQLTKTVNIGKFEVLIDNKLPRQKQQEAEPGLRQDSFFKRSLKNLIWPFFAVRNELVVDGFIGREAGRLIKKYIKKNDIFLEVGCGDMSLRKYLPDNHTYNAMDVSLAEFHLQRVLPEGSRINVVIASATKIPLPSNSVSMIVATEVLEHITNVNGAMSEIERILKPGGVLIVSIPNNYCYKYKVKGAHTEHVQNWTFEGFTKYAGKYKFQVAESFMKGYWVPFPLWFTRTSYQLPLSSKEELYNTNFFYVFKKKG